MGVCYLEPVKGWRKEEAGIMPPDLNEVSRPLAVPSPQSCGGAIAAVILPSRTTANGLESPQPSCLAMGAGVNGIAEAKAALPASPVSKYLITPALRATFATVGACDNKAYSFKEILGFLKAYLYSKRHLFDQENILYINCKEDRLGEVLRVDRFHYNDVRLLIAKHIVPEPPRSVENPNPFVNDKTFSGPSEWTGSQNTSVYQERDKSGLFTYPVPGSSRQKNDHLDYTIQKIVIPDSSDCESVYSCQGYETTLCHNTEFEDTDDASEEIEYEEYELASDDEDQLEKEHSDESDSVIEDVEVALLAVHAVYEDELEEDFWADDSDNEEPSTDEDPELAQESWDCVSCGIKNKPFVRYCGKCWQLRKNWLPERPKRKRRKPRPKKKFRRRSNSLQSEGSATDAREPESLKDQDSRPEVNDLSRGSSTNSTDSGQDSTLIRTASTATTVSLGSASPPNFSFEQFSSQDSGICMSQEFHSQSSQELGMADEAKPSCSKDIESSSFSKETSLSGSKETERTREKSSGSVAESSKRKRKSNVLNDGSKTKKRRSSISIDSSEDEPLPYNVEMPEVWEIVKPMFLDYIKSNGMEHTQLTSKRDAKRQLRKFLGKSESDSSDNELSQTCLICCFRPKNATITHGRISHQATCYQCARRLLDTGARCPVCRRKIHMVSKNIVV